MISVTVKNNLVVEGALPADLEHFLVRTLRAPNPAYVSSLRFGRKNPRIPRSLSFFRRKGDRWTFPRGFTGRLLALLTQQGLAYSLSDHTRKLPDADFRFTGTLSPHQEEACRNILKKRFSVLELPTGAGKTVVALSLIAARRQPCCIVVHTRELVTQWMERAEQFLGLSRDRMGMVGAGRCETGRPLTVALVNSLYSRAAEISKTTGFLVVDECHRVPARTFTHAVKGFDSHFMLGLSATPFRRDGLSAIINFYVGECAHRQTAAELQSCGNLARARLLVRETTFDYDFDQDYPAMMASLCADPERNQMIASDVADFAGQGQGPALVVSDRREHCRDLHARITGLGVSAALLTGDLPPEERERAIAAVNGKTAQVLVATLQLIGEGFDCRELSGLFLTTPVKFSGRVLQVVGRVLRASDGKRFALIYDYLDRPGVLAASFASRRRAYRKLGI
ncbi:MAG: DEAD/DEAH box helicase [Thermodesulfobacteriota bacterium]